MKTIYYSLNFIARIPDEMEDEEDEFLEAAKQLRKLVDSNMDEAISQRLEEYDRVEN